MGLELLFLLLPVAALSGWLIGRRSDGGSHRSGYSFRPFSDEYFKGLNYLLDEQPDKAIEVFVRMMEVDSETVETHFALGHLFRRRGEVERAIRIHQNLIARPTLTPEHRNQALYELGVDYMRAGLFDRAETLFLQLVDDKAYGKHALLQLVDIFQQEKDWEKAIDAARRLDSAAGEPTGPMIAQHYCEMAEEAIAGNEPVEAMRLVKRALSEDRRCVRASFLEGRLHLRNGAYKSAIKSLKRVEEQDPNYLSEVIQPLQEAYRGLGRPMELLHYLRHLLRQHPGISIMLATADLLRQQQGEKDAAAFVTDYLRKHPSIRGMKRLIELKIPYSAPGGGREDLQVLDDLSVQLLENKPVYTCQNCGFSGKSLHWHCPSCKQWNTIKPIHGIEGE